jgi:hypothetical protein
LFAVAFFYVLRFALLLVGVFRLVSAWHDLRSFVELRVAGLQAFNATSMPSGLICMPAP